MSLEEKIDKLLDSVFDKGVEAGKDMESGRYEKFELFRKVADRKAILALIKEETLKARIDELELAKISPKFKIEERIAQLKAELEEK